MGKMNYLTAQEAATALGISRATLYAYVSRGLVRSEALRGKTHQRRYRAEDIQRLKQRKALRRNPAKTAEQALNWGLPVLESGLTLISDGHLYYRGKDALDLALNSNIEAVANLLWNGDIETAPKKAIGISFPAPMHANIHWDGLAPINALQAALIQAESDDPAAYDLRAVVVAQKGLSMLDLLARVAAGIAGGIAGGAAGQASRLAGGIAETLQAGWAPSRPETIRLINAALILCADHELNVSAFTARCVASAGSSPYAAVTAGLAALQGTKHGGVTRRVEALFQEVGTPGQAQVVLSGRLKRGEPIPGFGHPLYPDGDPRARLLLELIRGLAAAQQLELADAIALQAQRLIGEPPTIDFALVCLARALDFPQEAAIVTFAIGRTVGWLAHAIEQYRTNALIRPRARYSGPQP
jgi:citrate synthase